MITRGTTPTITFTLCDDQGSVIDLSSYEVVIVTLEDGKGKQLDIEKDRFTFNEDGSFDAKLTQAETLKLNSTPLKVQLRAKNTDGTAIASNQRVCSLESIIKEGAI